MLIPEKLKLNKYKHVVIPRGHDYFARYGVNQAPDSAFSGDESPIPLESKLDAMNRTMQAYDKAMQEEANKS